MSDPTTNPGTNDPDVVTIDDVTVNDFNSEGPQVEGGVSL